MEPSELSLVSPCENSYFSVSTEECFIQTLETLETQTKDGRGVGVRWGGVSGVGGGGGA